MCRYTRDIVGFDLLIGKKYEDIHYDTHLVDVPIVKYQEMIVLDTHPHLHLLFEDGTTRGDIPLPMGELGQMIHTKFGSDGHCLIRYESFELKINPMVHSKRTKYMR